jgi:fatty-acyl-CoA synthase
VSSIHHGPSLGELIVSTISRWGDRVMFVHGDRTLSYRQMGQIIGQVCESFRNRQLSRGETLAHLTKNCPEAFAVAAAAYIMGIRYVPLHPLGAVEDFLYIIEDAGCAVVVVQDGPFGDAATLLAESLSTSISVIPDGSLLRADESLRNQSSAESLLSEYGGSQESDVARLAYTGGTTGRPKGAMQTHRGLVVNTLLTALDMEWPTEIRFLCATPLSHATGYMTLGVWVRGGSVVLMDSFTAETFCTLVQRHSITATFLVPTMLYTLLDYKDRASAELSSLQLVIYGAAPTSPSRLKEAREWLGPVFQQGFGLTETLTSVLTLTRADHLDDSLLASSGRPYTSVQVALLDDHGEPVARGDVGELCVRGPMLMEAYWKQEEATRESFQHGWFHTGDMAYQDGGGYFFLVDRKKDLIITGGFNVYAREVEDVLATHPAVSEAAVIGLPDPKWGEAVTAIVTLRPHAHVTHDELKALVRERKGPVHVPKAIEFVAELPTTALGKLDKKSLRQSFARK